MIDGGLLFDYGSDARYIESVISARLRLAEWRGGFFVLKDRVNGHMSRFAVSVFDENGRSAIDLLLMGNTLYVLACRMAEGKWFVCERQPKEFAGCDSNIQKVMEFQSGYGGLGISAGSMSPRFLRAECSVHVAALSAYMLARAPDARVLAAAKLAFAYFAITIGEAIRFRSVAAAMVIGGVDPSSRLNELQRWVIDSSVRDAVFPTRIAVAGVHEKTSSVLFKDAMTALLAAGGAANRPLDAELLVGATPDQATAITSLINKTGKFEQIKDPGREAGLGALYSGYFKNRLNGRQLAAAQKFVSDIYRSATAKKLPGANNFANIDQALDA